jgi:hypothetical protein
MIFSAVGFFGKHFKRQNRLNFLESGMQSGGTVPASRNRYVRMCDSDREIELDYALIAYSKPRNIMSFEKVFFIDF